ncbi:MAG: diaminopimelate epimerase [Rhizobacter sp.]|nr:diaminopimelate epimerase [Chlorobiales bacterium]
MNVAFTKMSGAGNDFILIDNRSLGLKLDHSRVAAMCHRHTGIGADGLLLLGLPSGSGFDFTMTYYNADGKPGSMCGNGGRCITRFAALQNGNGKTLFRFEAGGDAYTALLLDDGRVGLRMAAPKNFRNAFTVAGYTCFYADTGSPHAVIFADDVSRIDVYHEGKKVRNSTADFPEGANVNFAEVIASDTVRLRTFERGVEDETLACGTGAVATALISYRQGKVKTNRVKLLVQSGETLEVSFTPDLTDVDLTGSASVVFTGTIDI